MVQVEENIQRELESQKSLHKARDSFCDADIVGTNILEFTKKSGDYNLYYNGEKFDSLKEYYEDFSYIYKGSVYVVIVVLNYGNKHKPFVCKISKSKEKCNKYIRKINKNDFRFRFNENDSIIHNTTQNKLYEFLRNNYVNSIIEFSKPMLYMILLIISMIIYSIFLPHALAYGTFSDFETIELMSLMLVFVGPMFIVLLLSIFANINNKFKKYKTIDLDVSNFEYMNSTNYESIEAKINITDNGLELYSEELDCKWFYKRTKNGLIKKEGINLMNVIPVQGETCVLTVKDTGYSDSPLVSENEKWWIDLNI